VLSLDDHSIRSKHSRVSSDNFERKSDTKHSAEGTYTAVPKYWGPELRKMGPNNSVSRLKFRRVRSREDVLAGFGFLNTRDNAARAVKVLIRALGQHVVSGDVQA